MTGSARRSKTGVLVGVAVLVVALVVVGLTLGGGGDGGGDGNGGSSPDPTSLKVEAEQVTDALLGAGGETPPVGSARGSLDTLSDAGRTQPAVAEILAVEIGPSGTLLRWRLKSTDAPLELRSNTFSSSEQPSSTASDVALVNPTGKELVKPFRFKGGTFGVSCVCSSVPNEVDQTGQELTGLYPSFSGNTTQVEVRIPGFPPVTGVPVTRR